MALSGRGRITTDFSWHWGSFLVKVGTILTKCWLYCIHHLAWPVFSFFCLATLGVCSLTFLEKAREPGILSPGCGRLFPGWSEPPLHTDLQLPCPLGCACQEHDLIFSSDALQQGYMSLDLDKHLLAAHLEDVQLLGKDKAICPLLNHGYHSCSREDGVEKEEDARACTSSPPAVCHVTAIVTSNCSWMSSYVDVLVLLLICKVPDSKDSQSAKFTLLVKRHLKLIAMDDR